VTRFPAVWAGWTKAAVTYDLLRLVLLLVAVNSGGIVGLGRAADLVRAFPGLRLAALEIVPQRRREATLAAVLVLVLVGHALQIGERLRRQWPCGKDRAIPGTGQGLCQAPAKCCRSSVVEHSLGKGEVLSSILSGSTSALLKSPIPCRFPLGRKVSRDYFVQFFCRNRRNLAVDAKTPKAGTLSLGALLNEGKTKKIHQVAGSADLVALVAKDDITAGDGAKHDIIPDKGRLANRTTCNVFRLLKDAGIPVAFEEQDSDTSFIAPGCTMLPYEVVTRREAHGSYLKRHPHIAKGQLFPQLLVEFYLKTKDKSWKGKPLVADDPLMEYGDSSSQIRLFDPAKPLVGQEPFLTLSTKDVFSHDDEPKFYPEMRRIARHAFLVLEKAWQLEGGTLVDLKVEFGLDGKGRLLLADVIDNDSWRVIEGGAYIDKQVYRDGGALDDVSAKYRRVAEITDRFRLPRQRIIARRLQRRARSAGGPDDRGDLLHPQGAGGRRRHPAPDGAGGAGHRGHCLYRALEWRRPHAVGDVDHSGHHRAGEREGNAGGRLVVVARAEQGACDDGAGAIERCAGGAADPVRPQPPALRACARGDRGAHGEYDSGLIRLQSLLRPRPESLARNAARQFSEL
jgi:phosphoribosylaminoimidazole-succinocarboxamide synthase